MAEFLEFTVDLISQLVALTSTRNHGKPSILDTSVYSKALAS